MGCEPHPSHSATVLVRLVQCVTGLRLTVAVNGSHLARGLCSPSPLVLRAAKEIETFSLALLLVYLNAPGKQWNQGNIQPRGPGRELEVLL